MNMDINSLDRRRFLRGTGVALSLPMFESFLTHATGADENANPRRLACFYFPDGVPMPLREDPAYKDWLWFPHGSGTEFEFSKVFVPLAPL